MIHHSRVFSLTLLKFKTCSTLAIYVSIKNIQQNAALHSI